LRAAADVDTSDIEKAAERQPHSKTLRVLLRRSNSDRLWSAAVLLPLLFHAASGTDGPVWLRCSFGDTMKPSVIEFNRVGVPSLMSIRLIMKKRQNDSRTPKRFACSCAEVIPTGCGVRQSLCRFLL
jgi:hypothetical protein